MKSTCPVCTHSQRTSIDDALADDSALGAVAGRYGVTIGELAQHWTCCTLQLTETPETDKQAERKARADAVRDAGGAVDFDAGALDALLDAILEPQPTGQRGRGDT